MNKKLFNRKEYKTPEVSVFETEMTGMLCQSIAALVIDDVEATSVESFTLDDAFVW